jgi:hypothetical protein
LIPIHRRRSTLTGSKACVIYLHAPYLPIHSTLEATDMPSNEGQVSFACRFRVLIAGASYGGLSAALTLLDLTRGKLARFNYDQEIKPPQHHIPVDITLVDEKDGFCTFALALIPRS